MDVRPDEAADPGTVGDQRGDTSAAGVEDRQRGQATGPRRAGRPRLARRPRPGRPDDVAERGRDAQAWQDREPAALGHEPGLPAVARSPPATMPRASSQRSASIAALAPSPAAVTAWR